MVVAFWGFCCCYCCFGFVVVVFQTSTKILAIAPHSGVNQLLIQDIRSRRKTQDNSETDMCTETHTSTGLGDGSTGKVLVIQA